MSHRLVDPTSTSTRASGNFAWNTNMKSNNGRPTLTDIRQIGPNSERHISGICSSCGTVLLNCVNSPKVPTRKQLEDALLDVFHRHLNDLHPDEV